MLISKEIAKLYSQFFITVSEDHMRFHRLARLTIAMNNPYLLVGFFDNKMLRTCPQSNSQLSVKKSGSKGPHKH